MKKKIGVFFLYVAILTICVSCSSKKDMQIVEVVDIHILLQKVDSINAYFVKEHNISGNQCVLLKSPLESDSIQQANAQNVFVADAIGFWSGAVLGAGTGLVIGTIICPGAGSLAGASLDFISGGLANAVVCSIVTAKHNNWVALQEDEPQWDCGEWINYANNMLFEDEILGSNIGWYHNDIIQNIWSNSLYASSYEDMSDYMVAYMENNHFFEFEDRELFISFVQQQFLFMSNEPQNYILQDFDTMEYQQIVEGYMATIVQIEEEARYDYTHSIMEEISQFGLDDENTFMLNGTISTYYYSTQLWNMNAVNNLLNEN